MYFIVLFGSSAMEEFINRFPEQVALKKEDGFTPLHLAAYYDRLEVLNLLGEKVALLHSSNDKC